MWEIWKERNKRIFKDREMIITSLTNKMEANIIEVMNNNLRNTNKEEGTFTECKEKLESLDNPTFNLH